MDLTVYREGELDYLDFTVERRKIETPTVVYNMDEDKIATIQSDFPPYPAPDFHCCLSWQVPYPSRLLQNDRFLYMLSIRHSAGP